MKMKNTNETIKSYLMQANSWSLEGVGANRCVEICPFPTPWMQMLIEDDWSTWWRLWMYAPSLKSAKKPSYDSMRWMRIAKYFSMVTLLEMWMIKCMVKHSIYRMLKWKQSQNREMWDKDLANGKMPLVQMWLDEEWASFDKCANKCIFWIWILRKDM